MRTIAYRMGGADLSQSFAKIPSEPRTRKIQVQYLIDRAAWVYDAIKAYSPEKLGAREAFERLTSSRQHWINAGQLWVHDFLANLLAMTIDPSQEELRELDIVDRYAKRVYDIFGALSQSSPFESSSFDVFNTQEEEKTLKRLVSGEPNPFPGTFSAVFSFNLNTRTEERKPTDLPALLSEANRESLLNGLDLGRIVPRGAFGLFGGSEFGEVRHKIESRLNMLEGMQNYPWPPPPGSFRLHWIQTTSTFKNVTEFLDSKPVASVEDSRSMVTLSLLEDYDRIAAVIRKEAEEKAERQKEKAMILTVALVTFGAVLGLVGASTFVIGAVKFATSAISAEQKAQIAKGLKEASNQFKSGAPEFSSEIDRVMSSLALSAQDQLTETPPEPEPPAQVVSEIVQTVEKVETPSADTGATPSPEAKEVVDALKDESLTERASLMIEMPPADKSRCESLRGILLRRKSRLGQTEEPTGSISAKMKAMIDSGALVKAAAIVPNLVPGTGSEASRVILKTVAIEDHQRTGKPTMSLEAKKRIFSSAGMSLAMASVYCDSLPGKGIDISQLPPDLGAAAQTAAPGLRDQIISAGKDAFLATVMKQVGQASAAAKVILGSGAERTDRELLQFLLKASESDIGSRAVQAGQSDFLNAAAFTGEMPVVEKAIAESESSFPWIPVTVGGGTFLIGAALVLSSNR